jgi:hypothetical protein
MPRDTAKALLATAEARELLPPIASVLSCPVIVEPAPGEVAILGKGYHPDQGGLLITGGELPPQVPFEEAVAALKWIINEFNFQSPADHSRALAAIITPALRLGGALPGKVPIDAAEADKSQAGKGHRLEINCSFYRESAYIVTQRKGGVGGLDESFASALVSGRPFICFDNVRGKLDSPHVESYFTAPGMFPARVPKVGEVLINAKRFLIQLTSNGIESTTDLANRSSICRIRYRPHFAYRDTLGELKSRQPYFLGCVFSVVAEWIAAGKPRTKDCRHHFREWAQSLDWICRNLLGTAPLMDGHEAAQERASNPSLTWLRAVALAIAAEGRIPATLTATDICELCTLHGIAIPGEPKTAEDAPPQVGRLMRPVFANSATVVADEFEITRGAKEYRKPSGDVAETPAYTFNRESQ